MSRLGFGDIWAPCVGWPDPSPAPDARHWRHGPPPPLRARVARMSPVATTLVILAVAVVAFMSNRIPLGLVAIGVSLALWATGILDLGQALAGFGDPTVIFIATLFVVGEALDSTGVTAWAGHQLIARGGVERGRLLTVVCLLV